MAVRPRADGSRTVSKVHLGLIVMRVAVFYLGAVLLFAQNAVWAGIILIVVSLFLYYISFVAARTVNRSDLTRGQRWCLLFSLGFPANNFLFDVAGAFNPLEHFLLILIVVCALALGVVVYAILDPLHKAYGCYPANVAWYDLNKGLCPQFFGDGTGDGRSPICREESIGNSCFEQLRPPPTWYYHALSALLGHAIIIFVLGAFGKFKGLTGKSFF